MKSLNMKKILSSLTIIFMAIMSVAQSSNDNFAGKWKTEVNVDNATVLGGQSDVQFKADLEKTIRDNNPTWYPIVKVGATYRF